MDEVSRRTFVLNDSEFFNRYRHHPGRVYSKPNRSNKYLVVFNNHVEFSIQDSKLFITSAAFYDNENEEGAFKLYGHTKFNNLDLPLKIHSNGVIDSIGLLFITTNDVVSVIKEIDSLLMNSPYTLYNMYSSEDFFDCKSSMLKMIGA
ncbi:hypothetical protein AKO1_002199, partial [Acrasis kona]